MNSEFTSNRVELGYHGCSEEVADRILIGGEELQPSEKSYDWLGHGIYFWEHGPERAYERAEERYEKAAVIGCVIQLGRCFDLLDRKATKSLKLLYPMYVGEMLSLPVNLQRGKSDRDYLRRELDYSVLNYSLEKVELLSGIRYSSVRVLFQEADPVFPGSAIYEKSHIQLAVRDKSCILGYFIANV